MTDRGVLPRAAEVSGDTGLGGESQDSPRPLEAQG